jgi:hypothetical protein
MLLRISVFGLDLKNEVVSKGILATKPQRNEEKFLLKFNPLWLIFFVAKL